MFAPDWSNPKKLIMFRSKKLAAFLLFFAVVGSTTVFAQTPQLPQQQQQKVEVSDAELSKFANAFQGIRMVNQEAQQEMAQVVSNGGLEIQRFNEIHQASLDPATELDATEEEKKQHQEILANLEPLQASFQEKLEKLVTDEGLTLERYEQIAMGIQTDPELQQRLQKELQG